MALERVPSDIRAWGGVARMSDLRLAINDRGRVSARPANRSGKTKFEAMTLPEFRLPM